MNKKIKRIVSLASAICLVTGISQATTLCSTPIEAKAVTVGDVNDDGNIDSADAVEVLVYYANKLANRSAEIDTVAADMNDDGNIDSADAVEILIYYAKSLVGSSTSTSVEDSEDVENEFSASIVSVNSSGFFWIDTDILGMTYDEFESKFNVNLPEQQNFKWWGEDLKNVDVTCDGVDICLMFQNDYLVMVIYDMDKSDYEGYSVILDYISKQLEWDSSENGGLYDNGYRWNFDGYFYECFPDSYATTKEFKFKQWYVWNEIYGLY